MREQPALRRRIAHEAARLIGEHGMRDYAMAKRKAAQRLGASAEVGLPKNSEIDDALREYQRLFHSAEQPRHLHALREAALEAMRYFARFEPRLVGAVLDGTADAHSAVCLHLYCDTPESVLAVLGDAGIAFAQSARRLRIHADRNADFPVVKIHQSGIAFDLTLLPLDAIRQAPRDRSGGKPMQRAHLAQVEALAQDES